ncbi:MAG: hypothetical protein E7203_01500 [Selenomonas ruminantium]|jgi:hypothetical protein|uniref:Uncharacterized protein n=1 Tax=Selenomonas ruminantium TaxID=971 RepID=A0A927WJ73_SELRU|nr:hypothetical protein [Selenomonas ruminantium]MBE6084142.1 hypothetical protein [Selenomonas ruminantium]
MSAFLGPIHYWMYDKIRMQEELLRRFAVKGEQSGWLDSAMSFVDDENRPLEEIIDKANIHGWISARIESVEKRYAELTVKILTGHEERLEELKAIAYGLGEEQAAAADSSAEQCYKRIEDCTLNGMPCDGVNIVTEKSEDHFSWEQRFDVHGDYWIKAGGKAEVYYTLRNQLIAGILFQTKFTLAIPRPNEYALCRA